MFILAAGFSLFASAQQNQVLRDRDPDLNAAKRLAADLQQANFHYGRFYLWSRLRIADAGYSDSAYLPAGGNDGGFALRVEAPQRLYFVPHKKTVLTAELVPGYNVVNRDGDDARVDYLARGDAHFLFNHLYLDVYTQRANQLRAHVADVNRLARVEEDETGVAGEVKYSSRTSALFTLRYRDTEYPEDRFDDGDVPLALLDRDERNARVSLMHKTFPMTSLFVAAEGSNYGFRNASYKDSRRRYYGAGALLDSGRSMIRLEAGPTTLDFEDPLQEDFEGATGSLRLTRRDGRWTYQAAATRDLGFAVFAQNNYFIAHIFSGGIDYAATRRLTLRANVAYERDDFEIPVEGVHRRDTISYSSIGFTYGLARLRVGIDGGWYERDTTGFGDTDSGIRYVLHLSFTP